MSEQRLQKILAAAGVDSRRKCEELILEGSVEVNGKVVDTLPVFADPQKDTIKVNGRKIRFEEKVYFLLNKPKGVICTNSDPQGRRKAIDFIPTDKRIFCVGRLDADTTGIILLTNDSELSNKLTHPKYGLSKKYVAEIKGEISTAQLEKLKKGIWLAEGKTNKASIKILKRNFKESMIEISIKQGLNRQIRRMFANVGLTVKSLKRTHFAKLDSRGLGIGKFRPLTLREISYLKNKN
ncbi:MAG: rRNA pseudouridine synthase [Sedimentisphaerales bacterium]|nr:rRNA pseudouridine synthase [Sedimentisphaerales bacterium]